LSASGPLYDLSAPSKLAKLGHYHPVEELQKQLIEIFWQIGFVVADGPEVETNWYNFEALNIPKDHPARDLQDTFYLENGTVPRTHTSSVQIRYMEANKPPIRIIAPGKVYRNEDEDTTHIWCFRQLEALVVDEGITLADLKGTLLYMLQSLFGKQTKLQLRPNYFPYVEPAVEMDASCVACRQNDPDCRLCKGTGWIELGGAGMVHPQVLKNVGIDPKRYSGFAFGFGIERMAAVKYGVDDVRQFWRPDFRFLEQF
jgi:phenylalanyl-tRNA synthetase alpha chain